MMRKAFAIKTTVDNNLFLYLPSNILTLFRMGAKRPPYQFFPCNFYKRKSEPQKLPEIWLFATVV